MGVQSPLGTAAIGAVSGTHVSRHRSTHEPVASAYRVMPFQSASTVPDGVIWPTTPPGTPDTTTRVLGTARVLSSHDRGWAGNSSVYTPRILLSLIVQRSRNIRIGSRTTDTFESCR